MATLEPCPVPLSAKELTRQTVAPVKILKCNILQCSLTRERRSTDKGRRERRELDFYHGSILILRQRLPTFYSPSISFHLSSPTRPSISSTHREEVTWQLLFAFLSHWRKHLIKFCEKRRLEEECCPSHCGLPLSAIQNLYFEVIFREPKCSSEVRIVRWTPLP